MLTYPVSSGLSMETSWQVVITLGSSTSGHHIDQPNGRSNSIMKVNVQSPHSAGILIREVSLLVEEETKIHPSRSGI